MLHPFLTPTDHKCREQGIDVPSIQQEPWRQHGADRKMSQSHIPAPGCLTETLILGASLNIKSASNQNVYYSTGLLDHNLGKHPGSYPGMPGMAAFSMVGVLFGIRFSARRRAAVSRVFEIFLSNIYGVYQYLCRKFL